MAGRGGSIVARLDPASKVREGQESELWVDATRIHLFDLEDGRSLTTSKAAPAAVDGGQGASGGEPEAPPPEREASPS